MRRPRGSYLWLCAVGLLLAGAGLATWFRAGPTQDVAATESDYRIPVTDPLPEPGRPDLAGEPRIDPPADAGPDPGR